MTLIGVAVGGALGALSRYALDGLVQDRAGGVFPWGTWVVNLTGSLAFGFLSGLGLYHGLGETPRAILGAGYLGAYTTFSTFTYETVRLLEEGSRFEAALNAAASVAAGLGAAALGLALAAAL